MRKTIFVFLCILLNLICLFPFTKDFQFRFFIDGFLFFVVGILLLKNNPYKDITGKILIFSPFILIHGIVAVENMISTATYAGLPLFFVAILSSLFCFYLYQKQNKTIFTIEISYIIFLIISSLFLNNYYNFISHSNNTITNKKVPLINLYDEYGNVLDLKKLKNKIVVIDLWDSRCSNCIKDFPKFESLKKEFENDDRIVFYSLNIYLEGDDRLRVSSFTKKYTFAKLYTDDIVKEKLNINGVPKYLILNEDLKVIYIGSLIIGKFDLYNNFYTIIDKIKNENIKN